MTRFLIWLGRGPVEGRSPAATAPPSANKKAAVKVNISSTLVFRCATPILYFLHHSAYIHTSS